MKNKEMFANEIIEIATKGETIAINNKTRKIRPCGYTDCSDCYFQHENYPHGDESCAKNLEHWANSEYIERKEFTEQEKAMIRALDKVEWVARDNNGGLYAYTVKPERHRDIMWCSTGNCIDIKNFTSCEFKAIKREDTEPTSREEILGEEKK